MVGMGFVITWKWAPQLTYSPIRMLSGDDIYRSMFNYISRVFYFFQVTTNPIPATLLPQQPHPPSAVLHQQNLSHAHPTVTKSESNSIIIVKSCQTWTGFSRQFLTIFGKIIWPFLVCKIIDALFWEKTVIILLEFSSCTLGFSKKKHNQKNCKNWVFLEELRLWKYCSNWKF